MVQPVARLACFLLLIRVAGVIKMRLLMDFIGNWIENQMFVKSQQNYNSSFNLKVYKCKYYKNKLRN